MEMTLKRKPSNEKCTIGELLIEGEHECWTCEDIVRDKKIYGKTAVPAGRYEVVITYSNRFKRPLPLLLNVPGFEGIRIHPGNTAEDTEGCILPGNSVAPDEFSVLGSRSAFSVLFLKIKSGSEYGKVFLTIVSG
jgi:hypothetical protein